MSGTLSGMSGPRRASAPLVRLLLAACLAAGAALSGTAALPAPVAAKEPNFPSSMSGYHNLPEMVAEVQQAAVDYPDILQVSSIGKSYQGRDILIAKISDNVAVDEGEPEVLIDALHHAREHLATEEALAILKWLTAGYSTNTSIRNLVNSRVIWVIFALNPDGMRYDLTGSPFRAWRKNRQPNAGSTAVGTDLNRNYGYKWGCCRGSSSNPASLVYRGPNAFSAPETQALRDFVTSRVVDGVQRIKTHVTLHTNGKLVLWPYAYTRTNIPSGMTKLDHYAFEAIGRKMAAYAGYKAEQSSDLYITDGDEIDWLYNTYRIFSYTMELYPAEKGTIKGDFYPDDSVIGPATRRTKVAILRLIMRAACPYADLGSGFIKADCGLMFDDFEINRGWTRNSDGSDTATSGLWQIGVPKATKDAGGAKQLSKASSGQGVLATGLSAGTSANSNDVDGGTTSITSSAVTLPADAAKTGALTFRYVFAHDAASTAEDSLQVLVQTEDGTRTPVFTIQGDGSNRNAAWASGSASLAPFAGQTIRIVVAATDGGADNLVEAAVDDLRIRQP